MAPSGAWSAAARRLAPRLRTWRRALHREPEVADREHRTQAKIRAALRSAGLRPQTYRGSTAVTALLRGPRDGPTVALRAELDALPVVEATGRADRSRHVGTMHACGHDLHMACLLGAATLLGRSRAALQGSVLFVFQPAEEEGERGGAGPLLERGIFDDPKVDYVVGQHVAPELPLGTVGWRRGPIMAAADHFALRVVGTGGHGGYPHRGPDAVLVAAEIIGGLQALVSRERDPTDPVVISVGMVHGGSRHNILPETVEIEGTVRTLERSTRASVESALRRRVGHLAESLGARVEIDYRRGYPVTSNHPATTDRVVELLRRELGRDRLVELERPVMGAEDFSRYLERAPGTFLFLGVRPPGGPLIPPHSPRFYPPDEAMVTGTAVLAAAAVGLQAR